MSHKCRSNVYTAVVLDACVMTQSLTIKTNYQMRIHQESNQKNVNEVLRLKSV